VFGVKRVQNDSKKNCAASFILFDLVLLQFVSFMTSLCTLLNVADQVATSTWQRVLLQAAGGFSDNDPLLSALPHHLERRPLARRLLRRLKPPYTTPNDVNRRFKHYFKVSRRNNGLHDRNFAISII